MRRLALLLLAVILAFALGRTTASTDLQPSWSVAGELSRTRAYAAATLVATGEILVVGGLDAADARVTLATSELFDPATGHTVVLPQQLLGRLHQTLTVGWGDRVVAAGGTEWLGDRWQSVASVDVYLPWSRTWLHASEMLQPRSDHGAVALADGRVFVTGGNYNTRLLRASEIYDPRTDTWSAVRPLPYGRTQFSIAALPDGTVLVAGGFQEDGVMTTSTLIYDPASDRWSSGPEMNEVRLNSAMVRLSSGDLLFMGGEKSGAGTAERYDWRLRAFTFAGTLGDPRLVAQGVALPDDRVVLVGGLAQDRWRSSFDPLLGAELWDPGKKAWQDMQGAPTKRAFAQIVATERGVYRLSGVGEDERAFSSIETLVWR